MGSGSCGFLKYVGAVGLGVLIAVVPIGPDRKEVSPVSETGKVVSVYSEREMEQIREFKDDARFVMWARIGGRNRYLELTVGKMLKAYSEMNSEVRGEVEEEMRDSLFYFKNASGGELSEFYEERVRGLGLDSSCL